MNNMEWYDSWRKIDADRTKDIQAGNLKGKTNIDPMLRIEKLTQRFGPCGIGWYTEMTGKWCDTQTIGNVVESVAWVTINLYVKADGEWSKPIEGIGGSKYAGKGRGTELNDEAYKMAETDALSVCCKKLGMAADLYSGSKDWATKYEGVTEPERQDSQEPTGNGEKVLTEEAAKDDRVIAWAMKNYDYKGSFEQFVRQFYKVTNRTCTILWNGVQSEKQKQTA